LLNQKDLDLERQRVSDLRRQLEDEKRRTVEEKTRAEKHFTELTGTLRLFENSADRLRQLTCYPWIASALN